jgi:hypothetical protein
VEDHGYIEVNSGEVLARLLRLEPVPSTPREVFQKSAHAFIRRKDGPRRSAQAIAAEAPATRSERVLIDGIRHEATLLEVRRLIGAKRFGVVFVHTPPNIAYGFYQQRAARVVSI